VVRVREVCAAFDSVFVCGVFRTCGGKAPRWQLRSPERCNILDATYRVRERGLNAADSKLHALLCVGIASIVAIYALRCVC
jgi:hypothetical protein